MTARQIRPTRDLLTRSASRPVTIQVAATTKAGSTPCRSYGGLQSHAQT
jgi:hypothetical protein